MADRKYDRIHDRTGTLYLRNSRVTLSKRAWALTI